MADERTLNLDPITREPGAHPVGTGVGAAAGGAAVGAAAGAFGGPVGAVVGAVAGAVAGGMGGKAVAESINPTAEESYWRDQYMQEPYYESGRSYNDYGPAYDLGWSARGQHEGTFEQAEPRMATDWDNRRRSSTLTWSQASLATRAAWNRAGSTGDNTLDMDAEPLDNDDVIDELNDLLESCRDGEFGFRTCADNAETAMLKDVFNKRADDCRHAAKELESHIVSLGGTAADGGTMGGAMHRGWVSVRGTLSTNSDQAMLDEAERGEDSALAAYRKALKQALPAETRNLVQRQAAGAQRNHDEIKAMRNKHRQNA